MSGRLILGLGIALLVSGCTPGGFSSTRLGNDEYRLERTACFRVVDDSPAKDELLDEFRRRAARLCGSGRPELGELQTVLARTGGSSFSGECVMYATRVSVTCKRNP